MAALRRTFADALTAVATGKPIQDPRNTKKPWTPRYAARRSAWHVLDHAWEIQDRAARGPQPRRVRIASRSKIQLPTTSATPTRNATTRSPSSTCCMLNEAWPLKKPATATPMTGQHDEAADLLRRPRIGDPLTRR